MSVSNDQSPPARKVIPYKKGGRRQSPFSGMAFQFSGTALDVAIQQREQEVEESPYETTAPELSALKITSSEAQSVNSAPLEVQSELQNDSTSIVPSPDTQTAGEERPLIPRPIINQSEIIEKQLIRSVHTPSAKRGKPPGRPGVHPELQIFIDRWKPFLTDTQIGLCAYIFNNSIAIDLEYCFTSTAKLMAAVSKTERQVKTVLNQLLDWQFLIKGETVVNAPREKRGTYYKLNLSKT